MKLRRIDFYPDDFLIGVAGMTPEQGHVYWVVCSLCYSTGGPIPVEDERIFRLIRARPARLKRVINELQTCGKLIVDGTQMYNRRAVNEMKTALKRIATVTKNLPDNNENNDIQDQTGKSLGDQPAPSPSPSPSPPVKYSPSESTRRSKKSRLKSDYVTPPEIVAWAHQELNLTPSEVEHETRRFIEYFTSPDAKNPSRADWPASQRNWLRRAAEQILRNRTSGQRSASNRSGPANGADVARAALAMLRPDQGRPNGNHAQGTDAAGGAGEGLGPGPTVIDANDARDLFERAARG